MNIRNKLIIVILIILAFFMIINPNETVNSANTGFTLWYSILVPALLPFFIVSDLLISSGAIKLIGSAIEPLIRRVFNLPGCAATVILMGFSSGFPIGALMTKRLYEEGSLELDEAEHLMSFTNNSSPLFILGAVGVGMMSSPELGYLLAGSVYSSNIMVGLLGKRRRRVSKHKREMINNRNSYATNMNTNNATNWGQILGDAIKNSINNILAVAGFVIFFSVLTRMLTILGVLPIIASIIHNCFKFLGLTYQLAHSVVMGAFEITIGIKTATLCESSSLLIQLLMITAILSFSGLSIISQIMSIVSATPIRISYYVKQRLLHMLLACICTSIGYAIFIANSNIATFNLSFNKILYSFDAWSISLMCLFFNFLIMASLIIFTLIMKIRNRHL